MGVGEIMNQEEKKKPKYNVVSNAVFTFKKLWEWDKLILFYILGKMPIIVLLPLCGVYLPKIIVGEIENGANARQMIYSVLSIAIAMLILTILQRFIQEKTSLHTLEVTKKMEQTISSKAMAIHYEKMDRPHTQVMIKKAYDIAHGGENEGIQALLIIFITIFANGLGFGVYTGILGTLNPLIIVFIILTTIVSYFVSKAVNTWVFRNRDKWLKLDLKLVYLTYKSSSFETAKDIRLYNMKKWFYGAFHKFMNRRIKWTVKMQLFYFLNNVVEAIMVLLRDGLAYGYLIYLVWKGSISVSEFVLYFGIISGFASWCSAIITSLAKVNQISLNVCDFREYLELEEYELEKASEKMILDKGQPCRIKLEGVSYRYESEDKATLKNINLSINAGEKIAVVGANGAGKTTFVKLICGLYTPTTGKISVEGYDLAKVNKSTYYEYLAPVFQDIRLLPISIKQNITLCAEHEVDEPHLLKCLKFSGMDKVIKKFPGGLDTLLIRDMNEKAVQLSGGEEQKLMLARALYKDAPIMILDEPTAALDPIAENAMYLKYNELTAHKTSIFISHRLASTRFCDRIILIENGEIIEMGTHDELLALGKKYANMFEVQAKYYKEQEEREQDECIS